MVALGLLAVPQDLTLKRLFAGNRELARRIAPACPRKTYKMADAA